MKRYIIAAGCCLALLLVRSAAAAEFCVNDFGAKADETVTNTAAIQSAIDAAATAGGGVVTFKPGTYRSGAIFLKSNVELQLQKGVVLFAIQDNQLFPNRPSRIAGIEMTWPSAVINVYEQTNVTISGEGTVDGNGSYWWEKFWGTDHKGGMLKDYRPKGLRWAVDYDCQRVRGVVVYKSDDIRVKDITIHRPGFWSLAVIYSGHVTVDGVIVRANIGGFGPSTDGVDIDSSHDILVQNCDIDCNDDDICLKAGRDADGLRVNRPTENVIIRNCTTRAGGGMVTLGSETSGGIRNVEVSNLKAFGTANGIHFKSSISRGGVIEHISIHDIHMEQVNRPINFELNWYPAYSTAAIPADTDTNGIPPYWHVLAQKVDPKRGLPEFRDITISNVTAIAATQGFYVDAYPEKQIHDVQMENVRIEAENPGEISNAADWQMNNVVLVTPGGENIKLTDSRNVPLPKAVDQPGRFRADAHNKTSD